VHIKSVTTHVNIHHISFVSGHTGHTVSRLPASSLLCDLNIFSFCWPPEHAGTSWAAKHWFNKRSSWEPLCRKLNYYEHEETFSSFLPRNSPVGRQHNFVARNVSRNALRNIPFFFYSFPFIILKSLFPETDRPPSFCYVICILIIFIPRGFFRLRLLILISLLHLVSPRLLHGIIPEEYKIDQDKARWHFRWRIYSSYLVNKTNLVHNLFLVYLSISTSVSFHPV